MTTETTKGEVHKDLPMTTRQAAERWGMSEQRVRILVGEGRVKHSKVGGGKTRAGAILIWQRDPPPRVGPGELTEAQRAVHRPKRKLPTGTYGTKLVRQRIKRSRGKPDVLVAHLKVTSGPEKGSNITVESVLPPKAPKAPKAKALGPLARKLKASKGKG